MHRPSPRPNPPAAADDADAWLRWGPYVAERQWGTVREDISPDGDAWNDLPHDLARSTAYRWGEDGIGGICDDHQSLCLALALWNGQDPILKERFFGLSNAEGNHGEDAKEIWHHLDNLPDHRWMRMLYRYPQAAFPYERLVDENRRRTRQDPEFELADTGIFDDGRFFDVEIDYAKPAPDEILARYTAHNRGDAEATVHLLPTLWFRADPDLAELPLIRGDADARAGRLRIDHPHLAEPWVCDIDGVAGQDFQLLFTDNTSNPDRARAAPARPVLRSRAADEAACHKDGIHARVVEGREAAVYAEPRGTKAAAWFALAVPAGGSVSVRLRLCRAARAPRRWSPAAFAGFDGAMDACRAWADRFYAARRSAPDGSGPDGAADDPARQAVRRQAWAGLLWSKQFYAYDVSRWLAEGSDARRDGRNAGWRQLRAHDIILMPDKWEYPWFAAWDLAFHCIAIAPIDPAFAKRQITLLLHDRYMHPNGQLPAYEWNFSDVNPPVQALAAWKVYRADARATGQPDTAFLQQVLHRLMLNFTWWVNREDSTGNNIFEGGFLGLDNIGVFDRSQPVPGADGARGVLEQADATSWMAMYALNLMRIAMELAFKQPVYEDLAIKFGEHFFYIAGAMADMADPSAPHDAGDEPDDGRGLWDAADGFYYDMLRMPDGRWSRLKLRTIAGLIPLFAVEVLDDSRWEHLPRMRRHMESFLRQRPDLAVLVSHWQTGQAPATPAAPAAPAGRVAGSHLFSLLRGHRMKLLLRRMLDESEFLSPHGVRSVSRAYCAQAFDYDLGGTHYGLRYTPAESDTGMFGGNSNWRGPVWMPLNYLIVESLLRFHAYYGDDFRVECPTGSGRMLNLREIARYLQDRLMSLFLPDADGRRPADGGDALDRPGPRGDRPVAFHEYFDGDTGRGLGASHQTGWTALAALL
jgi:hypothetical protein